MSVFNYCFVQMLDALKKSTVWDVMLSSMLFSTRALIHCSSC